MKFLADMGVATRVVEWLRSEGHDAVHLREEDLQKLPDKDIFKKAVAEGRIVITFDLDFGEIIAFSEKSAVSAIIFRLRNTGTPFVIERLKHVISETSYSLEVKGCIVTIEDFRYRIRYLPID